MVTVTNVREILLADAGYPRRGDCTCGRESSFQAEGPAIAPMDYILTDDPRGEPLTTEIFRFRFWVVDEIDLRRFLGMMGVSAGEVGAVAETHSDAPVRVLSEAIHQLLLNLRPEGRLSGPGLYTRLDAQLKAQGSTLEDLEFELREYGRISWVELDKDHLVKNFPHRLVSIFLQEIEYYLSKQPFNPRIHLVNDCGPELRIWWRKELAAQEDWPAGKPVPPGVFPPLIRPYLLLLDATADADLLREILCEPVQNRFAFIGPLLEDPEWPTNVRTYQYSGALVGRSTMGLWPKPKALTGAGRHAREVWYGRVVHHVKQLSGFSPDWSIGLITFKGIEGRLDMLNEATEYLMGEGINNIKPLYYGNLRGSNELEQVKVLVLLGCPIPDPSDFLEEASAFFGLSEPLTGVWTKKQEWLSMRDGSKMPVEVSGYRDDERLQAYFRQKCQSELYQAVHRIRPHLVGQDDERFMLIYTNMPIPGVKVDGLLKSEEAEAMDERSEAAVEVIEEQVAQNGGCVKAGLAEALAASGYGGKRSIEKWIDRSVPHLEKATETRFEKRAPGRPARFVARG